MTTSILRFGADDARRHARAAQPRGLPRADPAAAHTPRDISLEELHREDREADGLLVGHQTFEDLCGYWPEQSDDAKAFGCGITYSRYASA